MKQQVLYNKFLVVLGAAGILHTVLGTTVSDGYGRNKK